jgi:hypothetical protein
MIISVPVPKSAPKSPFWPDGQEEMSGQSLFFIDITAFFLEIKAGF